MVDFMEFRQMFASFGDAPIARGGQKTVWRARHGDYGEVVVKLVDSGDVRTRREIEIIQDNQFVAVPCIFETAMVVHEGQEKLAIIEEFIAGVNLRDFIKQGGRYDLLQAADFLEDGLNFLEEISAKHIVHRDIKPANIVIRDGRPVFLDFGIARVLGADSLTETGNLGPNTPGYAAPEQFLGMKREIDVRADIFSLGVVTYELLTGMNPFLQGAHTPFEAQFNTVTITPADYEIPGDRQRQFMGLISSMMNKTVWSRPRDAKHALDLLRLVRQTFEVEP